MQIISFHFCFSRAVTETINDVINACLVPKSPVMIERIECDNAIRDMELAKNTLQQPVVQPTTTWTYFETLDHVVDNSKRLGEAMTHIASASKNTNHQLFLQAIQETTAAVCSLVQSSAQVRRNAKNKTYNVYKNKSAMFSLGKLSRWNC